MDRAAAAAQVFVDDLGDPVPDPGARHHLARVLRLRPGETVVASDGVGRWRSCRYRPARRGGGSGPGVASVLEAAGPVEVEPRLSPRLTVAFAPAKGDRPEWVVQKLTELGIDRIVPLSAERSVVRWEGDRADRAVERLRRVALEAAAQSRRVWLPEVSDLIGVADLAKAEASAAEGEGAEPAGTEGVPGAATGGLVLAQLGGPPPRPWQRTVAVGPEGGWAPAELGLGLPCVGLGTGVLRSETAALVAAAALSLLRAATVSPRDPDDGEAGEPREPMRGEGKSRG